MTEGGTVPHIYAAIAGVMADVRSIGKNRNMPPEAKVGEYAYRAAEDVEGAIAAAFREHQVMTQSSITRAEYSEMAVAGKYGTTTWVDCRLTVIYRFTSLVDGSHVEFESAGEGRDNSDKATGKALTSAHKYAITQAFEVAYSHPDPEADRPTVFQSNEHRPPPPPQADNRTDAQRAAEEAYAARRAAQDAPAERGGRAQAEQADDARRAAQTRPASPDPVARASADLKRELNARPIDTPPGQPIEAAYAREQEATAALRTASAAVVQADMAGERPATPETAEQAQRCRDAIRAGQAATSRDELNRIILHAAKEGLLRLNVDGGAVGHQLYATRGTHQAVGT